ncbi:hydrogenase expression/formation protein [Crenobacter caeni]|uniref:Hydrogenase expression/formation protein n=1 Tax=Crenobacter caeni TaxID=2705474 RepID=A0A6B2KVF4_9NEIS|nr:hydrogenase expression/formation protein [Crenobacter caeni]NDV13983.1 hydrogenase expression/formation protein [Crenobacter caeni]
MKPFPIPVVGLLGPGSQPADEDFAYLPLPRDIEGFDTPCLPTSDEVVHLTAAHRAIAELLGAMQGYTGDAERYPVLSLDNLDADNRALINQLLGEGEVSAQVKPVTGGRLDIQESVFAGVWRVLAYDDTEQLVGDRVEVCPIPAALWREARAFASAELTAPDTQGVPLMNALPVIEELRDKLAHPPSDAHVINFSLLPMTPDDLDYVNAVLGAGNSGVFSRGYGKCRVLSTALRDVWRVQYFNGMNGILLDTVEITRMPEVALAAADDLADSFERLQEAYDWLKGETP